MGESAVEDAAATKSKPTILVPPRGSMTMESFLTNGSGLGFSPGPMTLVSSFFAEQGPFSFSQLLAGAMASPMAAKQQQQQQQQQGFLNDLGKVEEEKAAKDSEIGYKRNRPVNLTVSPTPQQQLQFQFESLSPLFTVPPGMSPSGLLNSPGFLSPLRSPFGMSHQQALAHVTAQAAFSQSFMQMQAELQHSSSAAPGDALPKDLPSAPSETLAHQTNLITKEPDNSKLEPSEVPQPDKKVTYIAGDKPASDGYNWRKYGQKHVKASECPRSYYKCTHLNCPVKKKVERSFDGRISEIVYKGQHNHDPPQPNKRGKDGSASERTVNSQVKPVIRQGQTEMNRFNEAVPVNCEPVDFQATTQQLFENRSVASHNDEMEGNAVVVVDDGEEDEPAAKRRSLDVVPSIPMASSHQTVTESKIVVQTRSEVDLLDDGYKWRKYGQKVVKGNPHPRSYYRCTYAGCNVRKHVERSSSDPKAVVTTYEGKHDHELPTGRYSGHGTGNSTSQQLKTQKMAVNKNPSPGRKMDYVNKDQIPMTLQLKEEQIVV